MPAERICGKTISTAIKADVKEAVESLAKKHGRSPHLSVVLVGERPDSATYVRNKTKAAADAGIRCTDVKLSGDATEDEVCAAVRELADDDDVHAILVQLPLPAGVDEKRVLELIPVSKDVDGFSAANIGELALKGGRPWAVACTPRGVMEMLARSGVQCSGKVATVVGRSNHVGMPLALLLTHANATVTMVHSRTPQDVLEAQIGRSDVVVAAIGRAEFVQGSWLKPGAIVIDIGITAISDSSKKSGQRLVGDVHFESAAEVAGAISPVPGGVGPMTIAMLLSNTVDLFKRQVE